MNQKIIKGGHTSHIPPHTSNRGITLIALVITIIVLLILAGVTINMVLGDDGIIGQAQGASEAQKNAEEQQQYEINNAYKEILRTEKNVNGIGDVSKNTVTLVTNEGNRDGSFGSVISKGITAVTYEGNVEEAKNNANIVKLNSKTYTNTRIFEKIYVENEDDLSEVDATLVIDLNGHELIYTGTDCFIGSIEIGELYIIDTSKNKTGKIIMLEEVDDNYTYQEQYDFNKDGVICTYDHQLISGAYDKSSKDEDWEQYEIYDLDPNGQVDGIDLGFFGEAAGDYMKRHIIEDYTNVYTDVAEGAFISQCIHNK